MHDKLMLTYSNLGTINLSSYGYEPIFDIVTKDDEYTLIAELPGVPEDEIQIKIINRQLMISGKKNKDFDGECKGESRIFGEFRIIQKIPDKFSTAGKKEIINGMVKMTFESSEEIEY